MALDDKSNEKSRRERRKEARLEKNRRKFDSWVHHQQSQKSTKHSSILKSKDAHRVHNDSQIQKQEEVVLTNSDSQIQKQEEVILTNFVDEDTRDQPKHSLKEDFPGDNAVIESNGSTRKKGPSKNSKTKFEKYLKMEMSGDVISAKEDLRLEKKLAKKLKVKGGKLPGLDDDISMLLDAIPSVLDSFEVGEKTSKSFQSEVSGRKRKKSKSVNEERGDEGNGNDNDGVRGSSDASFEKHDNTEDLPVPKKSKMKKRRKTNAKEYPETEIQSGVVSAEEDERIPTILDSLEVKKSKTDEVSLKKGDNSSSDMKCQRTDSSDQQQEQGQISRFSSTGVSETTESSGVKMAQVKARLVELGVGGNSKYVAPHMRSHMGNESEEYAQIRRRIRGLLNRMSESNLQSITGEISTIFRSVGCSMGSHIIGEEVLASCSRGPRGNEQYAAVFSAFVAGMACLVGVDFGAKLLASLAKCFEDEYLKEDNLSLRNLTLLLSYLYMFGVCSSDLIYDFLTMLSKRLTEVDVATILTILQACGMRLRGDDPVGMKNFIQGVQSRVNDLKTSSEEGGKPNISSKRMEFMLETICDIKNNKARPKEDTVQQTQIKKWLQRLRVDEILIRGLSWSKLLDPDKKGQWWLAGDLASNVENIEEVAGTIDREVPETQKMLQLAAAQKMNTDARRAIFCVIMSGEDYIDAFEKLLRLDLSGKQDREIMRVLVECCLQEKAFNKYYCVLASKLCSHDKNHKFTLQYCLWDHFKELESMPLARSMHLAKFIVEMVASFTISLAVLKVVDLSDTALLTPQRIMHFRMLFEAIFEFPDKVVWNAFTRIAVTPEYESLRNGIELFVSKYVVGSQKSLASKFKVAKRALNNVEGVLM